MRKILIAIVILLMAGCTEDDPVFSVRMSAQRNEQGNRVIEYENEIVKGHTQDYDALSEMIIETFDDVAPTSWGENIDGVLTEIDTDEKIVALTFDACDGMSGSYDEELINVLIEEEVPATLFIAGQWIEANEETFIELANNPLFEIANHGFLHKPLSVTGEAAYGIEGTKNVAEAFAEIYENQLLIKELTGEYPKYFRSGTAHYDDVAVEIIDELGLKVVNYNALGDAGGTFNKEQILNALATAQEGSIFLFHMNQPASDIASGVKEGIRMLKEKGYQFVQLQEYEQFLK
ncbi:polysaccharide deacetylase family protein [Amphibacillus sp. Q70]|uniref:polysaccharide deacetylase family protein n=1 Tax=Amphibacillus sp. Q70 TaxID=3453416 RepID=UPI003F83B0E9